MQCAHPPLGTVDWLPASPTQHSAVLATLEDLQKGTVYSCFTGRHLLVSSGDLLNTVPSEDRHVVIIPSAQQYIAELEVLEKRSTIRVISGRVSMKAVLLTPTQTTVICTGEHLTLGDSNNHLEFKTRLPAVRKLPQNPLWGFRLKAMDATDTTATKRESTSPVPPPRVLTPSRSEPGLTTSYQMSAPLQSTLKRVSREIQLRKTGQKDPKQPLPPMYEQVGNSIAYQLLLQSHPKISEKLINSMYPILKELQSTSEWLFADYLDAYKESLKRKATPQCLHPSDLPTIKFLLDLCVHVSSLPPDSQHHFMKPDPALWMQLLVIFSCSQQNREGLVDYRCPSKVVGCMNLTSMADNKELQCHSWEVLSKILTVPTPVDKKPPMHVQALTLLLNQMKHQLDRFSYYISLIKAILKFLSTLSTTVRICATTSTVDPENPLPYSQSYAREVFQLIEENGIRQVILDVPEYIQDDEISSLLQTILIALSPLPTPPRKIPPPKPKRARCRTQLIINPPTLEEPPNDKPAQSTHRKLPMLPPKKMSHSKSTEDLFERTTPLATSVEQSLPANLLHIVKPTIRNLEPRSVEQKLEQSLPSNVLRPTGNPADSERLPAVNGGMEQSLPANLSYPVTVSRRKTATVSQGNHDSVESNTAAGPKALTHYNRVSLNKKRGSYMKAVMASQQTLTPYNHETGDEKDHSAVMTALTDRKELLCGISGLWKAEKSLQAASNCIISCFFNETRDIPLFIDCLTCFHSHTKYWTLGVCVVLLPYLRQVLTTERNVRYLKMVFDTLSLIIDKFSPVILSIKRKKSKCGISEKEQRQACYHELHLMATTLPKMKQSMDNGLHLEVDKFHYVLAPFVDPLL